MIAEKTKKTEVRKGKRKTALLITDSCSFLSGQWHSCSFIFWWLSLWS